MSKKEAVILGLIAIGGLGVASSMASDSGGGAAAPQRFGRILGADGKKAVASDAGLGSTTYNIAGEAPPSFPAVPAFDMRQLFLPMTENIIKTAPAVRRTSGGYDPAPSIRGYVPTGISDNTWSYSKKEAAIQEAVAAGLPEHIAERELKHYAPAPKKRTLSQRISAAGKKGVTLKGSGA